MHPSLHEIIDGYVLFLDDTKANLISYRVKEEGFTLLQIIEALKKYLTSEESQEIKRALNLVSVLISSHIKEVGSDETKYFLKYFLALLAENPLFAPLLLKTIYILICNNDTSEEKVECFLDSLKREGKNDDYINTVNKSSVQLKLDVQSFKQPERYTFYKIIHALLKNCKLDWFQEPDANGQTYFEKIHFLPLYIQMIDGEKDPRNLILVFENSHYILANIASLNEFGEEFFEVTACYFPIDYVAPPRKPEVFGDLETPLNEGRCNESTETSGTLSAGLRRCLAARPEFIGYVLPLLIEKLESPLPLAKNEAIRLLSAILAQENPIFRREFARVSQTGDVDFWRQINRLLLSTADLAFDALYWPYSFSKNTIPPAKRGGAAQDLEENLLLLINDLFTHFGEQAFLEPFVNNCLHRISCKTADLSSVNESVAPTSDVYALNVMENSSPPFHLLTSLKLLVAIWFRPGGYFKMAGNRDRDGLVLSCLSEAFRSIRDRSDVSKFGADSEGISGDLARVCDSISLYLLALEDSYAKSPTNLDLKSCIDSACEMVLDLCEEDTTNQDYENSNLVLIFALKLKMAAICLRLLSMDGRLLDKNQNCDQNLLNQASKIADDCLKQLEHLIKNSVALTPTLNDSFNLFVPTICSWNQRESFNFLKHILLSTNPESFGTHLTNDDASRISLVFRLVELFCLHLADPLSDRSVSQDSTNDFETLNERISQILTLLLGPPDKGAEAAVGCLDLNGNGGPVCVILQSICESWSESLANCILNPSSTGNSSFIPYYFNSFAYLIKHHPRLYRPNFWLGSSKSESSILNYTTRAFMVQYERTYSGVDLFSSWSSFRDSYSEMVKKILEEFLKTLDTLDLSLLQSSKEEDSGQQGDFYNKMELIEDLCLKLEASAQPFYQLPLYFIEKLLAEDLAEFKASNNDKCVFGIASILDRLSQSLIASPEVLAIYRPLITTLTALVGSCLTAQQKNVGLSGKANYEGLQEFLKSLLKFFPNETRNNIRLSQDGRQKWNICLGSLLGCILKYDSNRSHTFQLYADQLLKYLPRDYLNKEATMFAFSAIFYHALEPGTTFTTIPGESLFWKQKLFTYLIPRLLQGYRDNTNFRSQYCVAISTLVTNLPRLLIVPELSKIFPILANGLKQNDSSEINKSAILEILVELTESWPHCVASAVPSLVDNLIHMLGTEPKSTSSHRVDMPARISTCKLLARLPAKFPLQSLAPQKKVILACLNRLRDDDKRLVRVQASKAINAWHLLGAGKNELL